MSELSGAEAPKVSKGELLRNAERLFVDISFESRSVVVTHDLIAGKVVPEIEQAVKVEYDRARDEELQRRKQKELEWKQRSIGRVINDTLKRQGYFDFVGIYEPKPRISNITVNERSIRGGLPLGEGWPQLPTSIEQSYFEGSLTVAGQEFTLDPTASLLSVHLSYPLSDGTRTDLGVTHTLYPYKDEIDTKTQVIFGDYWSGIPHQPFSDEPTDSSVYMNRTMEMFIDGQGYMYRS